MSLYLLYKPKAGMAVRPRRRGPLTTPLAVPAEDDELIAIVVAIANR